MESRISPLHRSAKERHSGDSSPRLFSASKNLLSANFVLIPLHNFVISIGTLNSILISDMALMMSFGSLGRDRKGRFVVAIVGTLLDEDEDDAEDDDEGIADAN